MLCEKCGQNEATVKFVQIENNKRTELHLCRNCAEGYANFTIGFDLQNVLSSMFQHGVLPSTPSQSQVSKQCPTCGLTISDIQKNGRLGCSTCYQVFQDELNSVLRKLHGSINHTGKVPARSYPKVRLARQIEEARKQLAECVRTENYEQAAHFRDEIRRLEDELPKGDSDNEGN